MFRHNATYSPEDDKLRLYFAYRLDSEEYQRVKDLGFRYAPKQECCFAAWTPEREDFCLEMAGEIEPEGTTLAERAAAKAERLEGLAVKRAREANSFHAAANSISERFAYGQPILVGHHSERKARRDKARMESAMNNAVRCADAVGYWNYRATSVERYANYKNRDDVRARRIKTLLAELRSHQRDLNESHKWLGLWEEVESKKGTEQFAETVEYFSGYGGMSPHLKRDGQFHSCWSLLNKGELTADEVVEISINHHLAIVEGSRKYRMLRHLLNRLGYERSELGAVRRFEGELTPVIVQAFLREHGADKPKATKTANGIKAVSQVPFPLHIAESAEIELSDDEWRDKMQSSGYEVLTKPKTPGILNFKALAVNVRQWGNQYTYPQIQMTKDEYKRIHPDYRGALFSKCRTFKVRVCKDPNDPTYKASWFCVFLTDSKEHPAPESDAVTLTAQDDAEQEMAAEA